MNSLSLSLSLSKKSLACGLFLAALCPHLIAAPDFSRTDQSAASPKPSISHELSRDKIHAQMLKTGESLEQEISENSSPEKVVSAAKKLLQKSPNLVPKSPEAKEQKLSGEGLLDSNIWTLPNDPAQMREVHRIGLEKDQAWQVQISLPGNFLQTAEIPQTGTTPPLYIPVAPDYLQKVAKLNQMCDQLNRFMKEVQKTEKEPVTSEHEAVQDFVKPMQSLMFGSGPAIPLQLHFPKLKKGAKIHIGLMDGGLFGAKGDQKTQQVTVDENGMATCEIRPDISQGEYRVVLRGEKNEPNLVIPIWYGMPFPMVLVPENPAELAQKADQEVQPWMRRLQQHAGKPYSTSSK